MTSQPPEIAVEEGGPARPIIMAVVLAVALILAPARALEPPPITPVEEFFRLGTPPAIPDAAHLPVAPQVQYKEFHAN